MINNPSVRHEFVMFFDVKNGNPNGDPDSGNMPRMHDNGYGYITDVCLKRKVRDNAVLQGQKIYVESNSFLQDKKKEAYKATEKLDENKKETRKNGKIVKDARSYMCATYYDIRMFGGVLVGKGGEGFNCGQVRGPLQISIAESLDEINSREITITRVAREKRKKEQGGDSESTFGEMGKKHIIDYALYRVHGFFSPHFAEDTGASADDMRIFWKALQNMWDHDHSANRGEMYFRRLFIFSHESKLGNARASQLFDLVWCEKNVKNPGKFSDYEIKIASEKLPEGVKITDIS